MPREQGRHPNSVQFATHFCNSPRNHYEVARFGLAIKTNACNSCGIMRHAPGTDSYIVNPAPSSHGRANLRFLDSHALPTLLRFQAFTKDKA